ncbi:MAG: hypothetical protein E7191_01250 [Erysipelotrichaceae bacterium]|nr:hypothetical protein [Erysipelotrichaceae bacterium]MBR3692933.1 PepSY domain-containing protein [Erysipelotrichales bacterium]
MSKKSYLIALLLVASLSGCSTVATQKEYIQADVAQEIAVNDAGLTLDQVISFEVDLDSRGELRYYEVDFVADGRSYEYDIDAYTGEILGHESKMPKETSASDTKITEEQAKQKAIERVPGATVEHIREFEIDREDGRLEYEGTIYYDKMEYEFEIDAKTGEFRSWDVEPIND